MESKNSAESAVSIHCVYINSVRAWFLFMILSYESVGIGGEHGMISYSLGHHLWDALKDHKKINPLYSVDWRKFKRLVNWCISLISFSFRSNRWCDDCAMNELDAESVSNLAFFKFSVFARTTQLARHFFLQITFNCVITLHKMSLENGHLIQRKWTKRTDRLFFYSFWMWHKKLCPLCAL